jgi:hypothetical protein
LLDSRGLREAVSPTSRVTERRRQRSQRKAPNDFDEVDATFKIT